MQTNCSTEIPYSTINYALIYRLNYKPVRIQYVPHILNENDKMIIIQCYKEILTIFKKCLRNGNRFTPKDCMWIRSGPKIPKVGNIGFQYPKAMLSMFWGPVGTAPIHILPKGATKDLTLFISNVLKPIKYYNRFIETELDRKKVYIHFGYSLSHWSKMVKNCFGPKIIHSCSSFKIQS